MTNEELKKKMIKILRCFEGRADWLAEEISDALIEAGIGDVGEWKHKAEIADRALTNTCAILYAQGVESPYSNEEWQLYQAKKELQKGVEE